MGIEIERKFMVKKSQWESLKNKPQGALYRQGYLLTAPQKTVRVRQTPKKGFITIKGPSTGASRLEYEYEIPLQDAKELLDEFPVTSLSKIRYKILFKGKLWEVDEYLDKNQGLIIAEIELNNEEETFDIPDWIGEEVTGETKYYNANLTEHPYQDW